MLNILDIILDWIKGILKDCIIGNLDGMFDQINSQVGEVQGKSIYYPDISSFLKLQLFHT